MKSIAIIPARGGSKRIPQKNIMDFNGKPMIAWTIEAALDSNNFDRVLVSTESEEIAKVAREWGAEVPFMRSEFIDDMASVSEATLSAAIQAESYWHESYEMVVQLMANCPLRTGGSIISTLSTFYKSESNFSISAFKYGWMNPWWAASLDERNRPLPLFKEALKSRSQDLEDLYCPTGAIWVANLDALKRSHSFYGDNYIFIPKAA
jgi:N-acylneuraminate cytidylyltransferase